MVEAEKRIMLLKDKEFQGLPATPGAKKKAWHRFFPRAFQESMSLSHFDFGRLTSRTV